MTIEDYLAETPSHINLLKLLFGTVEPQLILEVGACEGEDTIRYCEIFPTAKKLLFEPNPQNIELIQNTITKYSLKNVELFNCALSNRDEIASLYISSGRPDGVSPERKDWDYGNKSSSLLKPSHVIKDLLPWLKFKQKVDVSVRSLDSFSREQGLGIIDFIHIDVQGAELDFLCGASSVLSSVRCFWIEVSDFALYEGQPKPQEVEDFVKKQGFSKIFESMSGGIGDQFYIQPKLFCIQPTEVDISNGQADRR